jgi:alkanesulfonate monooxygenase SsuD/methylene tetrahydromethanopterin reductase-like flavin-dependent oxidoreductase (luciferase family)
MKHAMFLPYDTPDKMIEWAQKLEQAGFDSAWQGELTNSALIPLASGRCGSHAVQHLGDDLRRDF